MIKITIVAVTIFMIIGANLSNGMMNRLGLDQDILLMALIAFVIAGLTSHRNIALTLLVVVTTFGANVSEETARSIGYNPDYLLAGLVVLVVLPFCCKLLEGRIF
jgi:hypothetical protein